LLHPVEDSSDVANGGSLSNGRELLKQKAP
jgi:hypothetical protein